MVAAQVSSIFKLAMNHPIVSCGVLSIFLIPAFQVLVYFFPLLISTALCVAALVSFGGFPFLGDEREATSCTVDSNTWLGKIKRFQEIAKSWIKNKVRHTSQVESGIDLDDDDDDEDELGCKNVSQHEKRVRQLERTLSTLSFVSYEGIFDPDVALLQIDSCEDNASAAEEVNYVENSGEGEIPSEEKEENLGGLSSWHKVEQSKSSDIFPRC